MQFLRVLLAVHLAAGALLETGKHERQWPKITLPWGTWEAERYNENGTFYTFKNVRFGKAPVGDLRFNAPEWPDSIKHPKKVQDNSAGAACHQIDQARCDCPPSSCPKSDVSPFLSKIKSRVSEDCLFLDIYVPASAFEKKKSRLPVIVWFHGGGFLFGAKDSHENGLPLYQGDGILEARKKKTDAIFVVGNYRLGPFGWLAGPSVAKEGTPNAGAYDQRLVLEWVHKYIHLVGGDKKQVSAWGESAGASSIMFHLIANGGRRDPLFRKAIMLSPGFEWQWDNTTGGNMEQLFQNYTEIVGCKNSGLECLRSVDETNLKKGSQILYDRNKCAGPYSLGPAVDGELVQSLPAVALEKGNFWKEMDSMIISHVADEASSFVPKYIKDPDDLAAWLEAFLPNDNLAEVRARVAEKYDQATFGDPKFRATAILRDAFFVCSTRHLFNAYNHTTPLYMMQYDFLSSFGLAMHASDLLPLFWTRELNIKKFIKGQLTLLPDVFIDVLVEDLSTFSVMYQKYMLSHSVFGDPNTAKSKKTPEWSQATGNESLSNVMETGFSLIQSYFNNATDDKLNTASTCDFWTEVALNITDLTQNESQTGFPYRRLPADSGLEL